MEFTLFQVIYILSGPLSAYTVYRLMRVFTTQKDTNPKIEWTCYITYYVVDTITYIFLEIPILSMVFTLLAFFIISGIYNRNLVKRISAVVFSYLILFAVEMSVGYLSGLIYTSVTEQTQYSSIFGLLVIKLISFIIAVLLGKFKGIKQGEMVPFGYWAAIAVVPIASVYVLIIMFSRTSMSDVELSISTLLILLINFVVFYAYDKLAKEMSELSRKNLIEEQNQHYLKQLEMLETTNSQVRSVKHDMDNHMIAIRSLLELRAYDKLESYLQKVSGEFNENLDYIRTGNITLDSLLNYKIGEAKKEDVTVKTELMIEKLPINDFDITVIMGNLFDNSMEAVRKVDKNRNIQIKIHSDKGRIIIKVSNPFAGKIRIKNGRIATIKDDATQHGIGLRNVGNTVSKYNGSCDIDSKDGYFTVNIILYV